MTEENPTIEKIQGLVQNARQYKDMEFRLQLEELVKTGGEEAEILLAQLITNTEIPPETRVNIIMMAGYQKKGKFLIPLKRVIDSELNYKIKQEAIIAISKFNDRRALNILDNALKNITNPMLLNTINSVIQQIKYNNPILALLPRFLKGQKDIKTFNITVDILKKILTPADSTFFVKFLNCGDAVLEKGSYEILCKTGDEKLKSFIFAYFRSHVISIGNIQETECDQLYLLCLPLRGYLLKHSHLIGEMANDIKLLLEKVIDTRIRNLLLNLLCISNDESMINYLESIYQKESHSRETILHEMKGNPQAFEFLMAKFKANDPLKERVIEALLTIEQGMQYFIRNYQQISPEDQASVILNLPLNTKTEGLLQLFQNVFSSKSYNLKEILIKKFKESHFYAAKDILFSDPVEKEFLYSENDLLETQTELFPFTTFKKLVNKIAFIELPQIKFKTYLKILNHLAFPEITLDGFQERDSFHPLIMTTKKIAESNSSENAFHLFNIFTHIKTFNPNTYQNLNEVLNVFMANRKRKANPAESQAMHKFRENLRVINLDLQKIENGRRNLEMLTETDEIDFEKMENFISFNHLFIGLQIQDFTAFITRNLAKASPMSIAQWVTFLQKYPQFSSTIHEILREKAFTNSGPAYSPLKKLVENLPDSWKIQIRMKKCELLSNMLEQLNEFVTTIPVTTDIREFLAIDVLITDTETLKDLLLEKTALPTKIFIILDSPAEFSNFRALNAKSFVKPLSFHRLIKEILQSLYF